MLFCFYSLTLLLTCSLSLPPSLSAALSLGSPALALSLSLPFYPGSLPRIPFWYAPSLGLCLSLSSVLFYLLCRFLFPLLIPESGSPVLPPSVTLSHSLCVSLTQVKPASLSIHFTSITIFSNMPKPSLSYIYISSWVISLVE